MPKIDFYIISDPAITDNGLAVCRLIEKAYQEQHKLYVHVADETTAKRLDALLWTFKDDSFIPHQLYQQGLTPAPPVQIGFDIIPQDHSDILVNLSHHVPTFYSQFSQVLEIVSGDAQQQAIARERFRFYREQACEIATYKI